MLEEEFPTCAVLRSRCLPRVVGAPELAPELARIANDGHGGHGGEMPKKFPAFVASLPMNNVPASRRWTAAIGETRRGGVQICSSVTAAPWTSRGSSRCSSGAARSHDVPIWMHPARPATRADYVGRQKVEIRDLAVLGWPFERVWPCRAWCFRGLFEKLPGSASHPPLRRMIPFLLGARGNALAQMRAAAAPRELRDLLKSMKKKPIEYFRDVLRRHGVGGSAGAACGLDFFGADVMYSRATARSIRRAGRCFIQRGNPFGRGPQTLPERQAQDLLRQRDELLKMR